MPNINTIIEAKELESILSEFYHFEDSISIQFLRRSFNDHYIVQSGNKKFILRLYINNKSYIHSLDSIRFELDLLNFLHQADMPAIPPIRNKDNHFLSILELKADTRFLVLFPFAQGSPITEYIEDYQSIQLGKLLAQLHLKSNQFNSPYTRYTLNQQTLIDEPLNKIEKYTSKFDLGHLSFFKTHSDIFKKYLNALPIDNHSYGIIHGDPNPSNFFYDTSSGFSLFDFDHCGYGFRIHDLAVITLSFPESVHKNLLKGYESVRALKDIEKNSLSMYSHILQIKKFADIFDMLEITNASVNNKIDVAEHAYRTIKVISEMLS